MRRGGWGPAPSFATLPALGWQQKAPLQAPPQAQPRLPQQRRLTWTEARRQDAQHPQPTAAAATCSPLLHGRGHSGNPFSRRPGADPHRACLPTVLPATVCLAAATELLTLRFFAAIHPALLSSWLWLGSVMQAPAGALPCGDAGLHLAASWHPLFSKVSLQKNGKLRKGQHIKAHPKMKGQCCLCHGRAVGSRH